MKSVRRLRTRDTSCNKKEQLKNDPGELLSHIARSIMRILVAFFAYLEYYVAVRPYFGNYHGVWSVGFLDGAVVTSTFVVIGFYVWSICARLR